MSFFVTFCFPSPFSPLPPTPSSRSTSALNVAILKYLDDFLTEEKEEKKINCDAAVLNSSRLEIFGFVPDGCVVRLNLAVVDIDPSLRWK